jgi:hypothetical protein
MSDDGRIAAALAALADAPARLTALARAGSARWRRPAANGGWSAAVVLAHLRAADDVIAPRLLQIIARDEPPLIAFDERRWQDVACYDLLEPARSIATFAARREELLLALRRLPATAWQRVGSHEEHGRQTLLEVARSLTDHEAEHLAAIETLLATPA